MEGAEPYGWFVETLEAGMGATRKIWRWYLHPPPNLPRRRAYMDLREERG